MNGLKPDLSTEENRKYWAWVKAVTGAWNEGKEQEKEVEAPPEEVLRLWAYNSPEHSAYRAHCLGIADDIRGLRERVVVRTSLSPSI